MKRILMFSALVAVLATALTPAAARPPVKNVPDDDAIQSKSWFGDLSPEYSQVTEWTARAFLAANAQRYGLDPALDGLTLARSEDSLIGPIFVFEQNYFGVPVYGAQVKVNFNRAGVVVAVNSSYVPGIRLASIFPMLTQDHAQKALHDNTPGDPDDPDTPPDSRLVIYATRTAVSLAWEVVRATAGGHTWKAFVHANDGRLLGPPRDINRYGNTKGVPPPPPSYDKTGWGRVFQVNAVVATRDNSLRDNNDAELPSPYSVGGTTSAYKDVGLLRLDGSGYLVGQWASSAKTLRPVKNSTSSVPFSFLFNRTSDGFSETMGYYYIDYAQNHINFLGITNANNRQQVFSVNRYRQDNSYYSPSSKEITYGTGGVDDAEDAEVIWHEYGHAIQDNQVPGFGSTLEAGAMGEGFGDYLAGSLGAQLSGGFQDTCLMEWDATSYMNVPATSRQPSCLRRLDGTKIYPKDIVGEVHDDGEIWSATLWQIRGVLGPEKADKLIIQHHFLLARDSSFNTAANALVTIAKNLKFSRAELNGIRDILLAKGFTVTAQ
jgi:Zn-dependent metalloprotease